MHYNWNIYLYVLETIIQLIYHLSFGHSSYLNSYYYNKWCNCKLKNIRCNYRENLGHSNKECEEQPNYTRTIDRDHKRIFNCGCNRYHNWRKKLSSEGIWNSSARESSRTLLIKCLSYQMVHKINKMFNVSSTQHILWVNVCLFFFNRIM